MKYYWIASTIEIKPTVLLLTQKIVIFMSFVLILSHFRPFLLIFHFIDNFTISLGHQNPGPGNYNWRFRLCGDVSTKAPSTGLS